jgi:lipid-A-disaccharide synthase
MRRVGVEPIGRAEDATALGLVEVAGKIPRLLRLRSDLNKAIRAFAPDVVVTIDSPGLLLRVGKRAMADGYPVVHWGCPQVWAWRRGRIGQLASSMSALLCLLPFEPALFEGTSLPAYFVGHPAAVGVPEPRPERLTFLLAPGSRPEEIRRLWPVCRRVAQRLRVRHPDCRLVVPVAPGMDPCALGGLDAERVTGWPSAHAALVASGTATLELAARGIPMVAIYQLHPITWFLARQLVTGVAHVSLPNILAGREVVPEVLQRLDPDALADQMHALLGPRGRRQCAELAAVVSTLDGNQAVFRAGQIVTAVSRRQPLY